MKCDFIQEHPEMQRYWDTLPASVKGMIIQSHTEISSLGELQQIAENLIIDGNGDRDNGQ